MAWTYSDYETSAYATDQAKLDRLILHIQEVADKQGGKAGVSGGGMSVQLNDQYLARLEARRKELEDRVRRYGSGRSPISVANLNGRPR